MKIKLALVSGELIASELRSLTEAEGLELALYSYRDNSAFEREPNDDFDLVLLCAGNIKDAVDFIAGKKCLTEKVTPAVLVYSGSMMKSNEFIKLIDMGFAALVPEGDTGMLLPYIYSAAKNTGSDGLVFEKQCFRTYFNNSENLVSLINEDFNYEMANDAFRKYHKLDMEDIEGLSPSKLWGEETFESNIRKSLERALKGEHIKYKASFDQESSGSKKYYEVTFRPCYIKGSPNAYSLVETRDITGNEEAGVKADETLSENYFLEKYLPYGMFGCNTSGEVIYANDTFYDILEVGEAERKNIMLDRYFTSGNRFLGFISSTRNCDATTFNQEPARTALGKQIYALISAHTRESENGSLVIDCTLQDNTKEVTLEKKLRQAYRIEAISSLAGGIAHDFNTILTTINGYAELTLDEVPDDSEAHDYQIKLINSVRRAEDIVKQMLTFSRQIETQQVPVKIEDVVKEACNFMQSALPYNIVLKTVFDNTDGYVMADPTQLFRVFLNIMTNSMQAIDKASGKINVKSGSASTGKSNFAVVTISDTGPGIESNIIDRIYEPFFTTKTNADGTGMGLAVAHGIIHDLGGEINASSSMGEGTTFNITLPLYDKDDDKNFSDKYTEAERQVLYADANIYFSRTVALALEKTGYRVVQVSNEESLEVLLGNTCEDTKVVILRFAGFSSDRQRLIGNIASSCPDARIVLISEPEANIYKSIDKQLRKRIDVLHEPVCLREILNILNNNP